MSEIPLNFKRKGFELFASKAFISNVVLSYYPEMAESRQIDMDIILQSKLDYYLASDRQDLHYC